MIHNIFTRNAGRQAINSRQAGFYRAMIRREAQLGGQLFGPVPAGHRREFFCLDRHTWVWHEEWKDQNGKAQYVTTRYDVRPSGILKEQDGYGYQQISKEEYDRFQRAVDLYKTHVLDKLYAIPAQ